MAPTSPTPRPTLSARSHALATYFDNHFQFYGRKLNVEFFNGQGCITNELLGSGQQQADADAVTAAQSEHAFAELNGDERALRRGAGRRST